MGTDQRAVLEGVIMHVPEHRSGLRRGLSGSFCDDGMKTTLAKIHHLYDAFLIDQFGVLIDGKRAYDGAVEALQRIQNTGKPVIVLSNSGKRSAPNCQRLVDFGFSRSSFETVLTSGEIAYEHIKSMIGREVPKGARVLIIIRDGDIPLTADLPLEATDDPMQAQLVLIISRTDATSLKHYVELLCGPAERRVPCICVNPDQLMLTPNGPRYSTGRIASEYEAMGGRVSWVGKPFREIYEVAHRALGPVPKEKVLCIGDSPEHDVVGGNLAGHSTALVRTGIHADISDAEVEKVCDVNGVMPDHFIPSFRF